METSDHIALWKCQQLKAMKPQKLRICLLHYFGSIDSAVWKATPSSSNFLFQDGAGGAKQFGQATKTGQRAARLSQEDGQVLFFPMRNAARVSFPLVILFRHCKRLMNTTLISQVCRVVWITSRHLMEVIVEASILATEDFYKDVQYKAGKGLKRVLWS